MRTYKAYGYNHIPYKTLSSKQRRLLESILLTQSKTGEEKDMISFLSSFLDDLIEKDSSISYFTDTMGNIYVTKQTSPSVSFYPLLVSHTDTVHKIHPPYSSLSDLQKEDKKIDYYQVYKYPSKDNKGFTYDSDTGIGGDDKNGILILLSLLQDKEIPDLKCLFPVSEESGGKGVQFALSKYESFFNDISYIIEPDRRGNSDIICKWGDGLSLSQPFREIVEPIWESYGFSIGSGTFTDAFFIFEDIEVSTFNISCGYYNPHSSSEYVIEHDIKRTMDTIKAILKEVSLNLQWKKKYIPYKPPKRYFGSYWGKDKKKNSHVVSPKNRDVTKMMEEDDSSSPIRSFPSKKIIFGLFYSPVMNHNYYGYYDSEVKQFRMYNKGMSEITYSLNTIERSINLLSFITEYIDLFDERSILNTADIYDYISFLKDNLDFYSDLDPSDVDYEDETLYNDPSYDEIPFHKNKDDKEES